MAHPLIVVVASGSTFGFNDKQRGIVDKIEILQAHPLFGVLPKTMLEQLCAYAATRKFTAGATIFRKGDPGTGMLAVLSGSVKISVPSLDGREAVLNIIGAGEVLGEIALLDGRPRTADATAATDCEALVVERRTFIPLVQGNSDIALKLIGVLCDRLRRTSMQVEDVMFLDLEARLAKMLRSLATPWRAGTVLSITQRELGQRVGASRESTNKQLQAWAAEKWIRLVRGAVVILDPDAIAAIASPDFDSDRIG